MTLIGFWGTGNPHLYDILQRTTDPDDLIIEKVRQLCPWRERVVMDAGCGSADHALQIAREAHAVVAVDADDRMVQMARHNLATSRGGRVGVVAGDIEDLPFADGTFQAIYAFWAYFFGEGSEAGLAECERVLVPGGRLCVVQNYGGDELSQLWSDSEFACLEWPSWFLAKGFSRHVVSTSWCFPSLDEGMSLARFLWGEPAALKLAGGSSLEFEFRAAIYLRQKNRNPS